MIENIAMDLKQLPMKLSPSGSFMFPSQGKQGFLNENLMILQFPEHIKLMEFNSEQDKMPYSCLYLLSLM